MFLEAKLCWLLKGNIRGRINNITQNKNVCDLSLLNNEIEYI
jgi:hypothetical protein